MLTLPSVPRSQLAIGRLGNLIHVAGGLDSPSTITASHDAYDVTSNTWTHINDAPYAFTGAMGVGDASTGKFFVFGGQTSPFTTTNQTLIYDPVPNNWTFGAPMPDKRSNGGIADWGGKIYLFGGADNDRNIMNTLWEYDPVANLWIAKTPGPVGRFRRGCLPATASSISPEEARTPTTPSSQAARSMCTISLRIAGLRAQT